MPPNLLDMYVNVNKIKLHYIIIMAEEKKERIFFVEKLIQNQKRNIHFGALIAVVRLRNFFFCYDFQRFLELSSEIFHLCNFAANFSKQIYI